MQQFIESLIEHLKSNVTLYTSISPQGLSGNSESISITLMPSARGEQFQDKSRIRNRTFQILTKSEDNLKALNAIDAICEALDDKSFVITGWKLVSCEVYSEPSWLEKTERNEYIYTAAFAAEIIKE